MKTAEKKEQFILLRAEGLSYSNLTATELSNRLYGQDRGLTEQDIKHIAADYEAELHRYIYRDGEEVEHKQLTRLAW